jgi:hypothetical protein
MRQLSSPRKPQATSHKPQATSHKPQAASYKPEASSRKLKLKADEAKPERAGRPTGSGWNCDA